MKGYKITDASRKRKVGVACNTLDELKEKGCRKLAMKNFDVIAQLEDGTIVDDDDFFKTVPQQTLFILSREGEVPATGADILLNALKLVNVEYLTTGSRVEQFMTENLKEKVRILAQAIKKQQNSLSKSECQKKMMASSCKDDPDWFVGIETTATTKEKFMFRRAQERIRGYLYKSLDNVHKSQMYRSNKNIRKCLENTFTCLAKKLKLNDYFGQYFDRSQEPYHRLCEHKGSFHCEGVFHSITCAYGHIINPYESREARIVFSTWNLDHRIERSRQIVPSILEAAEMAVKVGAEVNSDYFFMLLFTKENLKLVNVICHDKGKHNVFCDKTMYLNNSTLDVELIHV